MKLIIVLGVILLSGIIFMLLWNFIVVGIFAALPLLNIWQATGLSFFIGLITRGNSAYRRNK